MLRYLLPLLALAGCAMTPREAAQRDARDAKDLTRLAERLRGYEPGKPQSCIGAFNRNRNVTVYGDTLVYRDGAKLYRTDTGGGCFGLRRDDIIVTRSFTGQICRGDIVTTVDRTSGFNSGSCTYGDFIPYTKKRA